MLLTLHIVLGVNLMLKFKTSSCNPLIYALPIYIDLKSRFPITKFIHVCLPKPFIQCPYIFALYFSVDLGISFCIVGVRIILIIIRCNMYFLPRNIWLPNSSLIRVNPSLRLLISFLPLDDEYMMMEPWSENILLCKLNWKLAEIDQSSATNKILCLY